MSTHSSQPASTHKEGATAGKTPGVAPRFVLPEAVGVAMPPEELAQVVQSSLEAVAESLGFPCMVAFSYLVAENLLRGISTVGYCDEEIRSREILLSDFSPGERALRTGQILIVAENQPLPPLVRSAISGEVVLVPLILGERPMAILIGQVGPDTAPRSPTWQHLAEEVAARASLVCELIRVSNAYQDELRLRQSSHGIAAAILEGRPLAEIGQLITDIVAHRLRVERVALYLRDASGISAPLALRHVSAEYGEVVARLPRPGPIMTRAMATGLPYYSPNAQTDPLTSPELRAALQREGITSILVATLQHEQTIKGALVVYPDDARPLTPAEIAVFQSMADQATLAVAMTHMLEQERDMAKVEERNRLAREMHDTVAQSLAALILQIETAQNLLNSNDLLPAREMLTSSRTLAKRALEDTRRAVQGLGPSQLDRRTAGEAIARSVLQWEMESGIQAQFIQTGEEQLLQAEQSTALLRISQEALSNIRKHAQAQRVRIGLNYGPESVTLTIEDDGNGFDTSAPPAPDAESGYGLFGMTERARLLGGELRLESTPGWGTRIQAILPYRPETPLTALLLGNRKAGEPTQKQEENPGFKSPSSLSERFIPRPSGLGLEESAFLASSLPTIRVLVVDDHAVTRQGIRAMLESSGDISVVGEAGDGAQAVLQAQATSPDVVLMDLQMPGVDGLEGLRLLHTAQPGLPVVILTTFQTADSVREALSAGARGYLLKDAEPQDLIAAVHAAKRGESLLSSTVTDSLSLLAAGQGNTAADGITDRDREILHLLAQGARNKEIATRLFVSPKTIEYHMSRVFAKLDVSNRAEAVRAAIERGLIPSGPGPRK